MSENVEKAEESATTQNGAAQADVGDITKQLDSLLNKLVPPSEVTISTIDGRSVNLPGAIPARRQVVVFRLIRELADMKGVSESLSGIGNTEGITGVIDVVLALSTNIEVAEKLGEIFDAAYPGALGVEGDAIDLLPLEELVTAIIPFSERFVKKVGAGMMSLVEVADQMPS